jgi:Fuc2NAc and GlcNAc transferase
MQFAPVLTTLVAAIIFCGCYRQLALRWQLLDLPNERSSHNRPTPAGGGVGLFLGLLAGFFVLGCTQPGWSQPYSLLLSLAGLLVLTGVVDDRYGLSVGLRFPLYALVCLASVWLMQWPWSPWLLLLASVYALWILNLFNFMDGIDGIAASEAMFVATAAGLLALGNGAGAYYVQFCFLLAAACAGFLCWNWSPARLFMGDAGSISIGFLLAALSLQGEASGALPLLCWLILLAVFIADATATLLWRAATGQAITQAHSLHLYQRLARHWSSHARVVLLMQAYNLLWLLPLALLALHWRDWAWAAMMAAYLPLLVAWLKAVKLP